MGIDGIDPTKRQELVKLIAQEKGVSEAEAAKIAEQMFSYEQDGPLAYGNYMKEPKGHRSSYNPIGEAIFRRIYGEPDPVKRFADARENLKNEKNEAIRAQKEEYIKYAETVYNKAVETAKNGNEKAAKRLLEDFYRMDLNAGTSKPLQGGIGGTIVKFALAAIVAAIISSCSKETNVAQIVDIKIQTLTIEELIPYFKKQQNSNEEIIALMKENNRKQSDILQVLIGMGGKMDEIIKILGNHTDLLVEISHNNDDIKGLLMQINAKVAQGVEIGANNNKLLQEILSKLSKLGDNDEAKIDLLKQILAKVTESVEHEKDTDAKTLDLLQAILAKIDTMNANQKAFFEAVLAKLGKMDEKGQAALEALLKAIQNNTTTITTTIEGLGNKGKASLDAILKAINEGNTIAKGSQEVLVEILAHLGKLGEKADTIIELLQKIVEGGGSGGSTVDLTKVLEKLDAILNQEKANGNVLVEIRNKIESSSVEFKKILLAILDKIPHEHQCDHSEIIEILLLIVDEFNKHEGTDQPGTGAYDLFNDLFA